MFGQVYSDGVIETMTARVMDDYLVDELQLGIGLKGMNYFTQDRLSGLVRAKECFSSTSPKEAPPMLPSFILSITIKQCSLLLHNAILY